MPSTEFAGGSFGADFFEELESQHPVRFAGQRNSFALHHLELHRPGFDRLLRDLLTWDFTGVMKGRPKKELAWVQFLITIVELERKGKLTRKNFPDSGSLTDKILVKMHETGIDEKELDVRTLRPIVKGLWSALLGRNVGSS